MFVHISHHSVEVEHFCHLIVILVLDVISLWPWFITYVFLLGVYILSWLILLIFHSPYCFFGRWISYVLHVWKTIQCDILDVDFMQKNILSVDVWYIILFVSLNMKWLSFWGNWLLIRFENDFTLIQEFVVIFDTTSFSNKKVFISFFDFTEIEFTGSI